MKGSNSDLSEYSIVNTILQILNYVLFMILEVLFIYFFLIFVMTNRKLLCVNS